jgi:CheY-like chemotaxis protein
MAANTGALTILAVDDDVAILRLLSRILEGAGFSVLSADTGEEALELAKRESVDLAIVDYVMPGMNGAELYWELMKLSPAPYVIMISGFPKQIAEGKTDTSIPEDLPFLAKPFTPRQLLAELKRASLVPPTKAVQASNGE